jgi:hypothetical protein
VNESIKLEFTKIEFGSQQQEEEEENQEEDILKEIQEEKEV